MIRYSILLLLSITFIFVFNCGVTDPEIVGEETEIEQDLSLQKSGIVEINEALKAGDIFAFSYNFEKTRIEVVEMKENKVITKIHFLKNIVVSPRNMSFKYLLEGDIQSVVIEQKLEAGVRGVAKLVELVGEVKLKRVLGKKSRGWFVKGLSKVFGAETDCPPEGAHSIGPPYIWCPVGGTCRETMPENCDPDPQQD